MKECWTQREIHPLAALFPEMEMAELSSLADEIERHGYHSDQPITLYEGKILDGRNRYLACLALHREGRLKQQPPFVEWQQNGATALEWVIGRNLHRRHLTTSQRAIIAAELEPRFAEEARARQLAALQRGDAAPVVPKLEQRASGRAVEKAGKALRVGKQYVQDAKKLLAQAPDLAEKVKAGEVDLQRARSILKKQERPAPPPPAKLPDLAFDVLYADPPWRYDFCSVDDWAVENSYPTLDVPAICALAPRVQQLAHEDAILFLWATSPKLPDALEVLRAWGFTYKTSAVWVKHRTGAGMGYYVRVDHELLLIGTRGKFGPPPPERRFSSILEAPKGRHSEKPEEARLLIERMYPNAERLELFARGEHDGWTVWGSEAVPEQGHGDG